MQRKLYKLRQNGKMQAQRRKVSAYHVSYLWALPKAKISNDIWFYKRSINILLLSFIISANSVRSMIF